MQTLKKALEFKGVGLHSGEPASVTLRPCELGGVYFRTGGGLFPIASAVVEEDSRLTGFRLPDGTRVRTAEHLLASVTGMGLDSVEIEPHSEEIPILDGSAHQFAAAIAEAGLTVIATNRKRASVCVPIVLEEPEHGRVIAAAPSDVMKVTYVIDYAGTPIGTQRVSCVITPENFLGTISRARTFGLTMEMEYLRQNGLAKGGSLDNALVFDKDKLLNGDGLRFPLEPVTHKVVDLLGDLALTGNPPVAHYIGICAGHGMHGRLVEKLKRILASDSR